MVKMYYIGVNVGPNERGKNHTRELDGLAVRVNDDFPSPGFTPVFRRGDENSLYDYTLTTTDVGFANEIMKRLNKLCPGYIAKRLETI